MPIIKLNRDKFAVVDVKCFDQLNLHTWVLSDGGYAVRSQITDSGRKVVVYMHREVMNFPRGFDVDHVNGDKLNNRIENLRAVTKQQNQFNRGSMKGSLSQYKGVSWFVKYGLWRATIRINKKTRHIGLFATETDAAGAYNALAIKHHGEYARLNNVPTLDNWMEKRAFSRRGVSEYRGVSLHKPPNKWKASISFNNKRIHIGIYDSEIGAARAYNRKSIELRGDKAVLNHIPSEMPQR